MNALSVFSFQEEHPVRVVIHKIRGSCRLFLIL